MSKVCDCHLSTDSIPAMAEVARLQAQAILALINRDAPGDHPVRPTTAHRPPVLSIPSSVPSGLLISSSTGSISIADWDAMSEARLRGVDTALKKIVDSAMIPSISWTNVGLIIQRELAAVGFVFNTVCDSTMYQEPGGWQVAQDKSLSDLVRMRGAMVDAGKELGRAMWVEEMLRIAVRLMELRGV